MLSIYNTLIYHPLYNGFIFLINTFPWADAGMLVILLTVLVKLVLFPLSKKSVITQIKMKEIQPDIDRIKEKYKDDKQEQARKTFALYKEKKVQPFLSILLILIQLPIIFALYRLFWQSGLPKVTADILYGFVHAPETINMFFLGFLDISQKNIPLAILVGVTTYFQMKFITPKAQAKKEGASASDSFKHDLARSMSIQMKYIFPVLSVVFAYSISTAISLYWITSNLFAIGQELFLRKKYNKN